MARMIPTEFQKYEFDNQDEAIAAQILPQANHQFIQTQLAMCMVERAGLTYDHKDLNSSIQIEAYRYLLTCHDAAVAATKLINNDT